MLGDIIQFRICQASAQLQGFDDQDFYEFAEMVPMADAEIIQLQNKRICLYALGAKLQETDVV